MLGSKLSKQIQKVKGPSKCSSSQEAIILKHCLRGPVSQSVIQARSRRTGRLGPYAGAGTERLSAQCKAEGRCPDTRGPFEPQLDPGNRQELEGSRKQTNKQKTVTLSVKK